MIALIMIMGAVNVDNSRAVTEARLLFIFPKSSLVNYFEQDSNFILEDTSEDSVASKDSLLVKIFTPDSIIQIKVSSQKIKDDHWIERLTESGKSVK